MLRRCFILETLYTVHCTMYRIMLLENSNKTASRAKKSNFVCSSYMQRGEGGIRTWPAHPGWRRALRPPPPPGTPPRTPSGPRRGPPPQAHSLRQNNKSTVRLFNILTCILHCTENPIYVFLFWELRGFSSNFYIQVSVCDLYSQDRSTLFPAAK